MLIKSFYRIAFFPLVIGEHVYIGEGAVVSAASVGSYVYIGKDAIIVSLSIVQRNCMTHQINLCFSGKTMHVTRLLYN